MATVLRITDQGGDAAEFEQVDPGDYDRDVVACINVPGGTNVLLTRLDLVHVGDWVAAVLADVDSKTPEPIR